MTKLRARVLVAGRSLSVHALRVCWMVGESLEGKHIFIALARSIPLQAYKRKFVVLLNYPTRGLKAVDILEDEFSADTAETIEVSEYDKIEVQERQSKSKGKYSFQVRRTRKG